MTKEDKIYLNKLITKQRVFNQMGNTLTSLSEKLTKKQKIFAISTRVVFTNKEHCTINMGEIGLGNEKCVKAYHDYIKILIETLKEDYTENNLRIRAMESKNDVKKNIRKKL